MSAWTFVNQASTGLVGWTRTFTPSDFPAGVADGDLIVFVVQTTVDCFADTPVCTTSGWINNTTFTSRMFYVARYYTGLSLPTINLTTGTGTFAWESRMAAFRSSMSWSLGQKSYKDGAPPPYTSLTTTTNDTLLVLLSSTPGSSGSMWYLPADFATVSENTVSPMLNIAWKNEVNAGTTLSNIRSTLISGAYATYSLVQASQSQSAGLFLSAGLFFID